MKKIVIVLAFVMASQISHSQSLFTKAISKIAKIMPMPAGVEQKTATLTDVVLTGGIQCNLPTTQLGTINQALYSGYRTGGDQVAFSFSKKNSLGFCKIDGTLTVDGMPFEYVVAGTYSLITDANPSPKKIDIITTAGEKASFTIEPNKNKFKVISINGQKENISLDLTKDVVVELEGSVIPENSLLKVGLAVNQASVKSMVDVCYVRAGSKITVPAAAFRNLNLVPAANALYNYKKSYLEIGIESVENATAVSGSLTSVQYTSVYTDGKLVTITAEPELNTGLSAKGRENLKDGEMNYEFIKPNAFRSRPVEQIKKIGVISFGICGTTYKEIAVITQEENFSKGEKQIIATTTLTFPKQSNEVWAAVLEKMYPEITAIVQSEFNAPLLPLKATALTSGYKSIEAFSRADKNTDDGFLVNYPDTKLFTNIPLGEYGNNGAYERMMKESDANALMTLLVDLQLEKDGDFAVLVPKLTFEIIGKANVTSATKYFTGTIIGKGIQDENIGLKTSVSNVKKERIIHNVGLITADELDKIIRRSDLLTVFAKALKEIKEKEMANGDYLTVWNLQK